MGRSAAAGVLPIKSRDFANLLKDWGFRSDPVTHTSNRHASYMWLDGSRLAAHHMSDSRETAQNSVRQAAEIVGVSMNQFKGGPPVKNFPTVVREVVMSQIAMPPKCNNDGWQVILQAAARVQKLDARDTEQFIAKWITRWQDTKKWEERFAVSSPIEPYHAHQTMATPTPKEEEGQMAKQDADLLLEALMIDPRAELNLRDIAGLCQWGKVKTERIVNSLVKQGKLEFVRPLTMRATDAYWRSEYERKTREREQAFGQLADRLTEMVNAIVGQLDDTPEPTPEPVTEAPVAVPVRTRSPKGTTMSRVLDYVKERHPNPVEVMEVQNALGMTHGQTTASLFRLLEAGQLVKPKRGVYALADDALASLYADKPVVELLDDPVEIVLDSEPLEEVVQVAEKNEREEHTVEVVKRRLDGQMVVVDEDGELWLMKKVEV